MQFSVNGAGKQLFGDGFAFWYTKERNELGCYGNYYRSVCYFIATGPILGNRDFFTGLGIFFDTYSNHNGVHAVSNDLHRLV